VQEIQHGSGEGSTGSSAETPEGVYEGSREVVVTVLKAGWSLPVATASMAQPASMSRTKKGLSYLRVELADLRLSHPAVLFLLQGASMRQLLRGVILEDVPGMKSVVCSVVFADVPSLKKPPFVVRKAIMVHTFSSDPSLSDDELFRSLLESELSS
jgi:hypothetical protein